MTIHLQPIVDFVLASFLFIVMEVFLFVTVFWNDSGPETKESLLKKRITYGVISIILATFWYGWIYGFINFSWK